MMGSQNQAPLILPIVFKVDLVQLLETFQSMHESSFRWATSGWASLGILSHVLLSKSDSQRWAEWARWVWTLEYESLPVLTPLHYLKSKGPSSWSSSYRVLPDSPTPLILCAVVPLETKTQASIFLPPELWIKQSVTCSL